MRRSMRSWPLPDSPRFIASELSSSMSIRSWSYRWVKAPWLSMPSSSCRATEPRPSAGRCEDPDLGGPTVCRWNSQIDPSADRHQQGRRRPGDRCDGSNFRIIAAGVAMESIDTAIGASEIDCSARDVGQQLARLGTGLDPAFQHAVRQVEPGETGRLLKCRDQAAGIFVERERNCVGVVARGPASGLLVAVAIGDAEPPLAGHPNAGSRTPVLEDQRPRPAVETNIPPMLVVGSVEDRDLLGVVAQIDSLAARTVMHGT